jgi:hypothetical protein
MRTHPPPPTADQVSPATGLGDGDPPRRPGRSSRLRLGAGPILSWTGVAARPLGIYLASRFVVLIGLWTASRLLPGLGLITTATAWDGGWYLMAAQDGYPHSIPLIDGHAAQSTIAFFPLYPLSVRAVHALGFPYRPAALLVAGAAGMVAVVLLWLLLRQLWGREAADRGVALFCFFPGALVLSLSYSEPLMLALAIGCLLALLSERWVTAGVLAALATATRPNAIALVAACAWAAGAAIRTRRQWRALIAPLLAPAGFVVFQLFLWARTGAVDAWYRTQHEGWEERLALDATWHKIEETIHHPLSEVNIPVALAGTVVMVVTLVLLIRARPPAPVLVYAIGIMFLALVSETLGARPRFVLTAFPLVVAPGRWLRGNGFAITLACSATLLGSFTVVSMASRLATP